MFTVFKCVSFCHVMEETEGHFPNVTTLLFLSSRWEIANVFRHLRSTTEV